MSPLQSVLRSSALKAAAAFGTSGLALAVGNLLLAKVLPKDEFARFVLLFSIVMIGISMGPIGADVTLQRRKFRPDAALHWQVLATSAIVALILMIAAAVMYSLRWELLGVIFVSITAGSIKTVAVSYYRSQQRFLFALSLTVSTNAALLLASFIAFVAKAQSALFPAVAMALSLCASSLLGWYAVAKDRSVNTPMEEYSWSEGCAAMSFAATGMILGAFERLAMPQLLGLPELATFSVLATLGGSPFQMLHLGVGYTLLPKLRSATTRTDRSRIFKHEALVIFGICLLSAIGVWFVAPLITRWFLDNRYSISGSLLLAVTVSGFLKVIGSLMASVTNALGHTRNLIQLSFVGVGAIVVAAIGAFFGTKWNLLGVIYGVSFGWLFRAIALAYLAIPNLLAERT